MQADALTVDRLASLEKVSLDWRKMHLQLHFLTLHSLHVLLMLATKLMLFGYWILMNFCYLLKFIILYFFIQFAVL